MVAAGVDPNTPLEDAVDEFGDALNRNFGPVGSEGRTALSKAIENGFRKGREKAGLDDNYEPIGLDPAKRAASPLEGARRSRNRAILASVSIAGRPWVGEGLALRESPRRRLAPGTGKENRILPRPSSSWRDFEGTDSIKSAPDRCRPVPRRRGRIGGLALENSRGRGVVASASPPFLGPQLSLAAPGTGACAACGPLRSPPIRGARSARRAGSGAGWTAPGSRRNDAAARPGAFARSACGTKKSLRAAEQDRADVAVRRRRWRAWQPFMDRPASSSWTRPAPPPA